MASGLFLFKTGTRDSSQNDNTVSEFVVRAVEREELGPEPNKGLDGAWGCQGRTTDSEAEAGDQERQVLPLDCDVRNEMGNDISATSELEPGVSVSVAVNEGVHVW